MKWKVSILDAFSNLGVSVSWERWELGCDDWNYWVWKKREQTGEQEIVCFFKKKVIVVSINCCLNSVSWSNYHIFLNGDMKLCFSYLALTSEFCMSRVCLNIFDIKNVGRLLTIAKTFTNLGVLS